MVTSIARRVITPPPPESGISAHEAREIAHITYRQLDHWARQCWVVPSVDPGTGRAGRRLYSVADVVRLALLRHLASSKVNTAVAGPLIAEFEMPTGDSHIVWNVGDAVLEVLPSGAALKHLEDGGSWIVFNPADARAAASRLMTANDSEPVSPAQLKGAASR